METLASLNLLANPNQEIAEIVDIKKYNKYKKYQGSYALLRIRNDKDAFDFLDF
ncbi:hypothetical protein AAHB65_02020 [Bacillus toyonensis]